jgi:hypothetical protein
MSSGDLWGQNMRVISVLKAVSLAGAVVLLAGASGASAKKLPPGACLFHHKVVAAGALCSYDCDPATKWCSQQSCLSGQFSKFLPCLTPLCTEKCG